LIPESDALVRLLVAVLLGGIVGFERQSRNKSAGLRTHILVSLGACLTMIVSLNISLSFFFIYGLTNADPERIAAQVISGIGFLGAGTILANKKGLNVIGLTTAASLWVVAAIGLAAGAGYWITASATTLFVYLTLAIMSQLEKRIKVCSPTTCQYDFLITTMSVPRQISIIGDFFEKKNVSIREFHIVSEDEKNHLIIFISVESPLHITANQIISGLLTVEGIIAAKKDMILVNDS
jgi:putative Mg2+ transporter-C (MgtC) family protein